MSKLQKLKEIISIFEIKPLKYTIYKQHIVHIILKKQNYLTSFYDICDNDGIVVFKQKQFIQSVKIICNKVP